MASTVRTATSAKSDIVDVSRRSQNSDFNWDAFDAGAYREHNYRTLRDDDQQIIGKVRDFFAETGLTGARGLDVGAGANLYPALSMLPFCRRVDLREFAASNLAWLTGQVPAFDNSWYSFWAEFAKNRAYAEVKDPRAQLARIAKIGQGSIFNLPRKTWDMGTMFFVACSISTDIEEFRRAVRGFVKALKPGAPFAAAFMVQSEGYYVGQSWFPAVRIDAAEIDASLASVAYSVRIDPIDTGEPLRDGYGGMSLATGRASA